MRQHVPASWIDDHRHITPEAVGAWWREVSRRVEEGHFEDWIEAAAPPGETDVPGLIRAMSAVDPDDNLSYVAYTNLLRVRTDGELDLPINFSHAHERLDIRHGRTAERAEFLAELRRIGIEQALDYLDSQAER